MQKKRWLLLGIFILFFPSVYSVAREEVYSGTLYSGDSFNVSGEDYSIYYTDIDGDRTDNRIQVDLPSGTSIILQQGLCEGAGNREICFDSIEFWYRNYTLYKNIYNVKIIVYEKLALMELERTVERKTLLLEETTAISSVLRNTGDRSAFEVEFKDPFPEEFDIIQVDGCLIDDEGIFWKGTVDKNDEKECTYTIKAKNSTKFRSEAELSYFNGLETAELESDSETITVPEASLGVNIFAADSSLEINEETNISVVLENRDESSLYVAWFSVEVPAELKVVSRERRLRAEGLLYRWTGKIEPLEKMDFTFILKAVKTGDKPVSVRAEYVENNIRKKILLEHPFEVKLPALELSPILTKERAAEGEDIDISARITNPSNTAAYKDIKLLIESPLLDEPHYESWGQLNQKDSVKMPDMAISLPSPSPQSSYNVKFTLTYKSVNNEPFEVSEEKQIEVVVPETETEEETIGQKAAPLQQNSNESNENASESDEGLSAIKEEISFRRLSTSPSFLILDSLVVIAIFIIVLRIIRIRKDKKRYY